MVSSQCTLVSSLIILKATLIIEVCDCMFSLNALFVDFRVPCIFASVMILCHGLFIEVDYLRVNSDHVLIDGS